MFRDSTADRRLHSKHPDRTHELASISKEELESLSAIFQPLGHKILLACMVKEVSLADNGKPFVLMITQYSLMQDVNHDSMRDVENLNADSQPFYTEQFEYLVHKVYTRQKRMKRFWFASNDTPQDTQSHLTVRKATYFNLAELVVLDGSDFEAPQPRSQSSQLEMIFRESSTSQKQKLYCCFHSQLEKSVFTFFLLQLSLVIVGKLPAIMNLNRDAIEAKNRAFGLSSYFQAVCESGSNPALEALCSSFREAEEQPVQGKSPTDALLEQQNTEVDQVAVQASERKRNDSGAEASFSRKEDLELDNLLYREGLYDIHFSDLPERLQQLIEVEESNLLTGIIGFDTQKGDLLAKHMESVSTTLESLESRTAEVEQVLAQGDSARGTIQASTEASERWLANLNQVIAELNSLTTRYQVSEDAEDAINNVNLLLHELQAWDEAGAVVRVVQRILDAAHELELALDGSNMKAQGGVLTTHEEKQALGTSLPCIREQKESLELLQLKLTTNVHFALMDKLNLCIEELRSSLLKNVTLAMVIDAAVFAESQTGASKIHSSIKEALHDQLLRLAPLVRLMAATEAEEFKKCYITEMGLFYTDLLRRSLDLVLDSPGLVTDDVFRLALSSTEKGDLLFSNGHHNIKSHLQNLSEESAWEKTATCKRLNSTFRTVLLFVYSLIIPETKFLAQVLFPDVLLETETAKKKTTMESGGKGGTRKVKFGFEEESPATRPVPVENTAMELPVTEGFEKVLERLNIEFFEEDALLYDLFLRNLDLLQELDNKIFQPVRQRSLGYEVLFIHQRFKDFEMVVHGSLSQTKSSFGLGFQQFFVTMFKDTCYELVHDFFQKQKIYIEKQRRVEYGSASSTVLELIQRVPNFVDIVSSIEAGSSHSNSLLEQELAAFLTSVLTWLQSSQVNLSKFRLKHSKDREWMLLENYYFLYHSLKTRQIELQAVQVILDSMLLSYETVRDHYAETLLKEQFRYLFDYLSQVGQLLATTNSYQDIVYQKPLEEYSAVYKRFVPSTLELENLNDPLTTGTRCLPSRLRNKEIGADAVSGIRRIKIRLQKTVPVESENFEVIKTALAKILLEVYQHYCTIGKTCYEETPRFSPTHLKEMLAAELELE